MPEYQELRDACEAMRGAPELYRPAVFWEAATAKIVAEIETAGVERFRSLPTPMSYFVPTWGVPVNGFTRQQVAALEAALRADHPGAKKAQLGLAQFLSGEMAASADYRVLKAADDPSRLPHLHRFSESEEGEPTGQFRLEGRCFSRSSMNYLLGLAFLKRFSGTDYPRVVLEVGGGFGSLGEVLASSAIPGWKYIDVDIPPTSFVAEWYLGRVLGDGRVSGWSQTRDAVSLQIGALRQVAVLNSWQMERLQGEVDLFVNFISFQEMEPEIVQNYLDQATRLEARWILLRNLKEGKPKWVAGQQHGVRVPVTGDDYVRMLPDYELIERSTLPFGHRTVDGFHSEVMLLRRRG
jgi:putative sugar O-methyltransferase